MATIDPEEPLAVAVVEAIHTGDLRRCSGYWPSIPDWPPLGWAMTALPGCPARTACRDRLARPLRQRRRHRRGAGGGRRRRRRPLVAAIAPWLLELPGVGPISAAQVLVSWSHAGRLRSEAAFAALAGANPIPASSGQVTRHRLNRSGDRTLNPALHTIGVARLRNDPATRAYAARRRSQGKSARDIRRCFIG